MPTARCGVPACGAGVQVSIGQGIHFVNPASPRQFRYGYWLGSDRACFEAYTVKIVIPGGSGQVGRLLTRAFLADGHEVVVLSRRSETGAARIVGTSGDGRQ